MTARRSTANCKRPGIYSSLHLHHRDAHQEWGAPESNSNRNRNSYTYCYSYGNSNCNSYSDSRRDGYANRYSDRHRGACRQRLHATAGWRR